MNIKVKFEDGSVKNIREIYSVVLNWLVKRYTNELELRELLQDGYIGLAEMCNIELVNYYLDIIDSELDYDLMYEDDNREI